MKSISGLLLGLLFTTGIFAGSCGMRLENHTGELTQVRFNRNQGDLWVNGVKNPSQIKMKAESFVGLSARTVLVGLLQVTAGSFTITELNDPKKYCQVDYAGTGLGGNWNGWLQINPDHCSIASVVVSKKTTCSGRIEIGSVDKIKTP